MFWTILLLIAFIAMLWKFWGKIWDRLNDILANPLSYLIPGLFWGFILTGVCFLCNDWSLDNLTLLGYHPFWVGLVSGTAWHLIKCHA